MTRLPCPVPIEMNNGSVRQLAGKWLPRLVLMTTLMVASSYARADPPEAAVRVRRLIDQPIIRPEQLPGEDGENINGPSLIRVPDWVTNRLGRYYLYFAHHKGTYLRMAYAAELTGPWQIYNGGVLKLEDAPGCQGHIASPDAVADEAHHQIRLYFHGIGRVGTGQQSFVAVSSDGLNFKASAESLGIFYFRVFQWRDAWYAMAKGGQLYRSRDGLTGFVAGPNPLSDGSDRGRDLNGPGARHVASDLVGSALWVYYSNIGDAPERIMRRRLDLTGDWLGWRAAQPEEILRPERPWEGSNLPLKPSIAGAMKGRENALRDPAIFRDRDGRNYLLYSVAGEAGIGIAELLPP